MQNLLFALAAEESSTFDFKKLWNDIVTFFTTKYWNIILFFAVLIVGFFLIKLVMIVIKKGLARSKMEQIAQSLLLKVLKYVLYLVFLLVLLAVVGIQITGIITALSAVLLAIGMALKDNIANFANGIIIVSGHMFNKGDFIEVSGTMGTVQDINLLFTTLSTVDNKKVIMPNSQIVTNTLLNYGANGNRRVDFTFSVAYNSDVEEVKEIVTSVMRSYNKIRLEPAPFCRLKVLNASSIDFFANCWCAADDYWDVYYYVMENVFNELKRKNISVPYAQSEVRLRTDAVVMPVKGDGLPERGEELYTEETPKEEDEFAALLPDFVKRDKTKKKDRPVDKKDKKSKKKPTENETTTPSVDEGKKDEKEKSTK